MSLPLLIKTIHEELSEKIRNDVWVEVERDLRVQLGKEMSQVLQKRELELREKLAAHLQDELLAELEPKLRAELEPRLRKEVREEMEQEMQKEVKLEIKKYLEFDAPNALLDLSKKRKRVPDGTSADGGGEIAKTAKQTGERGPTSMRLQLQLLTQVQENEKLWYLPITAPCFYTAAKAKPKVIRATEIRIHLLGVVKQKPGEAQALATLATAAKISQRQAARAFSADQTLKFGVSSDAIGEQALLKREHIGNRIMLTYLPKQ